MKFLISWQNKATNASPEERSSVADLQIFVGGQNVCEHRENNGREIHDHVTISTYPIAEGLAHDWWRIFGGRDVETRLVKYRGGYAIPEIKLRFDGLVMEIEARQFRYENPDIWFLSDSFEVLSRTEAEKALIEYLSQVISALSSSDLQATGLQLRWNRVKASLADPEESAFCEAAGALGLDPYSLSDQEAAYIEDSSKYFSEEALVEYLAGIRKSPRKAETLDWVRNAEKRQRYHSLIPELSSLKDELVDVAKPDPSERPWERGYRCARVARKSLQVSQNERFRTVSAFCKRLGAEAFRTAPYIDGVRALVQSDDRGISIHLRKSRSGLGAKEAQVFSFGRAVGNAVCFPDFGRSVVNDLHYADRQATGRAFAAEFIAPADEIESMQEDGRDVASIADDFGVSTEVIERQIQNRARIALASES